MEKINLKKLQNSISKNGQKKDESFVIIGVFKTGKMESN